MSYLAFTRGAELPIVIVAIVFVFVYLRSRVVAHERTQKRKIELVERALESGVLDQATKRELVQAITGRAPRRGTHWLFLLGWIGLFVGVALVILGVDNDDLWPAAIVVTCVSFAVLTIPIASRELHARAHTEAEGRVR